MSGGSEEAANDGADEQAIKLAVAISFLLSKFVQQSDSSSSDPSQSDALRWRQKAKERKQGILRLREDLNNAEDASEFDLFPQNAACKCYFFDRLGNLKFSTPLRFKERRRRRTGGSVQPQLLSVFELEFASVSFRKLDSNYLPIWSKDEGFDKVLFEERLASILQARKALELLESRNGVYVLYMDRVTGELAKQVSQVLSLHNTKSDIVDNLLW
ncbi:hypothetical protein UlMin_002779 [Ulmus minor]